MNLMQERSEIMHGLLFFWNCNVCRRLGWDKENGCPESHEECSLFVYNKLGKHFVAISEAKKKAAR